MKRTKKTNTSPAMFAQFLLPIVWLGVSYAVRFAVMEDVRWVEQCTPNSSQWICEFRALLGLTIHFGVLAWTALSLSVASYLLKGIFGRRLANVSFVFTLPALALYTVTPAVFALLIAMLRLARIESQSDSENDAQTDAQATA